MIPTILQNSFSLTFPLYYKTKWIALPEKSVHVKYQCGFSIACNHIKNQGRETNLKVKVQIICKQSEQKKFELLHAVCVQRFEIFSASLLTFAPRYFCIPWLSPTLRVSADFPDNRNHDLCTQYLWCWLISGLYPFIGGQLSMAVFNLVPSLCVGYSQPLA